MIKVGYLGKNGTFSEVAANKYYKSEYLACNYKNFKKLIKDVSEGKIDDAILPVENSTTGIIYRTYDLLKYFNVFAVGEVYVRIQENLIGIVGSNKSTIKSVYSHPEVLAQCSNYLNENDYNPISYKDTASSCALVKEKNDVRYGALASSLASNYHDLIIIEENVQDNKLNTTRFLVVTNRKTFDKKADKVSMYFVVNHKPGSLYEVLEIFKLNNINLLKLESRPLVDSLFEYCFYIDFEGNLNDDKVKVVLNEVGKHCLDYKILGNYVKANF